MGETFAVSDAAGDWPGCGATAGCIPPGEPPTPDDDAAVAGVGWSGPETGPAVWAVGGCAAACGEPLADAVAGAAVAPVDAAGPACAEGICADCIDGPAAPVTECGEAGCTVDAAAGLAAFGDWCGRAID